MRSSDGSFPLRGSGVAVNRTLPRSYSRRQDRRVGRMSQRVTWGPPRPRLGGPHQARLPARRAALVTRASRPSPPGTGAATRRERWARLRRSLWQPPRPHGEQPRERVVGPLELFYDLAVVVLVAQDARHLAGHLSWRGLGEFAVVFTLVWIAWANGSLHHELHGHDDARGRSTFL